MTANATKRKKLRNNEYYATQTTYDDLYSMGRSGKIFKNLLPLITCEENIRLAYRNVKRNSGSTTPGANDTTIRDVEKWGIDRLISYVRRRLDDFQPHPVRRVNIPKDNGKTRPLGIPSLEDRIIQQCILQVLEPICESKFHPHSYGFRPLRSTHDALARSYHLINLNRLHYVVDIDIKGFFDNVDHGKLLKQLWNLGIRDKSLLCILSKQLKAEVLGEGIPPKGTPQGGIISPLLANVVLNELDWWVSSQWETFQLRKPSVDNYSPKHAAVANYRKLRSKSKLKECFIVRYADDFKIFCRDYISAQKMFIAVKQWLIERLGLEISHEKSRVINLRKNYSEFLGFKIKAQRKTTGRSDYCVSSRMSDKAVAKAKTKIKKAIIDVSRKPDPTSVNKFNAVILGLHNYNKVASLVSLDFKRIFSGLRFTLRNRLRNLTSKTGISTIGIMNSYKGFSGAKTYVMGRQLAPPSYVKFRAPMNFNQEACYYTPNGRTIVHRKLSLIDPYVLDYLLRNPIKSETIEYNDNRISRYVGQNGKCAVTGNHLGLHDMDCHHITPRQNGGNDRYDNLVIVTRAVHKLIHATTAETISVYLSEINPTPVQLERINELRILAGNNVL